jgi:chromosome segregation ATPase
MKFEEDCNRYENCILVVSKEILIAKNWFVDTNNENEKLRKEVGNLVVQLQDIKEHESALKEKVEQLEVKVSKEGVEKENLTKAINQLEKKVVALETMMKEKDEGILDLGEEKREAIRQLCIWIEYHQSRYEYLREMLSKMPIRGQRAS